MKQYRLTYTHHDGSLRHEELDRSDWADRVRYVRDVCGLNVKTERRVAGQWKPNRAPRPMREAARE